MVERFTPRRMAARARREGWKLTQMAADLPTRCTRRWSRCVTVRSRSASCTRASTSSWRSSTVLFNRLVVALIVTGGLIGSSLIGIFAKTGPHFLGLHVVSVLGFGLSAVLGVWLLWSVLRSGRL